MNFRVLFELMQMLMAAAFTMQSLGVGVNAHAHSTDVGIAPAWVTWHDGRQFTIALHIERVK